jgi:hypothetical protein
MSVYWREYRKSHAYYKQCEKDARVAALQGECLKAEKLFLAAAEGRKNHCMNFHNGIWDANHKARYDICIGSAWIQRDCIEQSKLEDEICYERHQRTSRPIWNVWRSNSRHSTIEDFSVLLRKHSQIKNLRRANRITR